MAKLNMGLAAGFCAGILAGCGGGSDDNQALTSCSQQNLSACGGAKFTEPATTAQTPVPDTTIPDGLFVGMTSTGRTATGLVLDDGSYYFIYSAQNNPAIIAGAAVGSGTALDGSFSSSNTRDINLEGLGLLSASVSAKYTAKKSFSSTINYPSLNQTITATGTYDANYELTPSLAIITGSYTGRAGAPSGTESASLTISSAGTIAGIGSSGCGFSGTVAPRAKGNVYNAAITFGGSPCLRPNATLTGAAYFDAATKRLYAVGLTVARDDGVIFAGSKL